MRDSPFNIMRNFILLLAAIPFFYSCKPELKSYDFVIHKLDSAKKDITSSTIIREYSDSAAHIKALEYFANASIEYYQDGFAMKDTLLVAKPLYYSLFDKEGREITDKTFPSYDLLYKNRYLAMILSARQDYILKMEDFKVQAELSAKMEKERLNTIKNSKLYFRFDSDEFNGLTWVIPKSAPRYLNRNGIYCYFQSNNDVASNFRLRIQYTADNWLFIRSYQFVIDGFTFSYTPDKVERDNNSTIWEWSDQQVSSFDMSLINALYSAQNAKIRFVGKQYHKDRVISKKELESIRRAFDLFVAMKGKI